DHGTYSRDRRNLLGGVPGPRRLAQRRPVAEMTRQAPGVSLADMADSERVEKAVKRDRAARLDGAEQVSRRCLAEALPFSQGRMALPVTFTKRENVGRRADQPLAEKELDQLFAQSLDVEGVARHEMLEALDRLGRTDERAGAAAHHVLFTGLLVDLAQGRRAADGTGFGENVGRRILRPLVNRDRKDLRDDIARALHRDRVADPH